jgi:Protein of unknown function (DUF2950)
MTQVGLETKYMTLERRGAGKFIFGGMTELAALAALAAVIGLFTTIASAQSSTQNPSAAVKKTAVRSTAGPQTGQQTFPSAAEGSAALIAALKSDDLQQLLKVLGQNAREIIASGDDAADKTERRQIVQKYEEMHRLVLEPDGTTTLYIGAENWPTPIPLMHKANQWYFDTAAGKQEILYRRIGRNELAIIQVCREVVDAEKEYYSLPHDGDSGQHYAGKFFSDPAKHNGLYWKPVSGEAESPIGPSIAGAAQEDVAGSAVQETQPFEGYYFRMLKAQGAHAPGGARSFAEGGKMTSGFAFVAYPAKYRSTGVMTFIVNQDGIVYEKDLGLRTEEIAKNMSSYGRDASWRKAD